MTEAYTCCAIPSGWPQHCAINLLFKPLFEASF